MVGAMRERTWTDTLVEWVQCICGGIAFALVLSALAWFEDETLPRHATWLAVMSGVNLVVGLQTAERARR
jgi:heme A synthase